MLVSELGTHHWQLLEAPMQALHNSSEPGPTYVLCSQYRPWCGQTTAARYSRTRPRHSAAA